MCSVCREIKYICIFIVFRGTASIDIAYVGMFYRDNEYCEGSQAVYLDDSLSGSLYCTSGAKSVYYSVVSSI